MKERKDQSIFSLFSVFFGVPSVVCELQGLSLRKCEALVLFLKGPLLCT